MLPGDQIAYIRDALDHSKNPLFFFHDDPDGLCSFLLLYKRLGEGRGVIVKTTPVIDEKFLRKVEEYSPDRIFILDIARVEDSFIEGRKAEIIWVDHHGPYPRENIRYFNPRIGNPDDNLPVSSICYEVAEDNLWIAAVGTVADWTMPYFMDRLKAEYPYLLDKPFKTAQDILFNTKLGQLAKIFSFVLKGSTSDAMRHVKVLSRIDDPREILDRTSSQGNFLYRRYEMIDREYQSLLKRAESELSRKKLFVFVYSEDKMSFTGDLSNEMIYRHPSKVVIIGRRKNGEIKCSLRSSGVVLPGIIGKSLVGLTGYGGGHENACGACIKEEDFPRFLENFRKMI